MYLKANQIVPKLGYTAKLKYGDGYMGWPSSAPFDKIIVTCGAPYIPNELVNQLKPKGRLVIPIGAGKDQEMLLIVKEEDGSITKSQLGVFSFVPMLKETAK